MNTGYRTGGKRLVPTSVALHRSQCQAIIANPAHLLNPTADPTQRYNMRLVADLVYSRHCGQAAETPR